MKEIARGGCNSIVYIVRNMNDEKLYILKKVKYKEPAKDGIDRKEALKI